MKIGLLTSWNTQCGIAEYSRYLANAFRKRDDVELTVFGSRNYDERKVGEDEDYVVPTFDVALWNREGHKEFDSDKILSADLDVLHVQYEAVLFGQNEFFECVQKFPGVKAITYHDNCIPFGFPYNLWDLRYTHREDVGAGEGYVLPFGIQSRPPVVKTFGLGRSREDVIATMCLKNGWTFEKSFGESSWKTQDELHNWLRDSDLIVLYYDDAPAAGSSQAARTAIGTRRPVIVNDTTWFKDLDQNYAKNVHKVDTAAQLEFMAKSLLENQRIELDSWDKIAETLVQDYSGVMCAN